MTTTWTGGMLTLTRRRRPRGAGSVRTPHGGRGGGPDAIDERGVGRGDERGDDRRRGGGDRPLFSITRLNLLSQFFACANFFSTAIR